MNAHDRRSNSRQDDFAPVPVDNAVSVDKIAQSRIDREVSEEVADVARKFNKVLGKISLADAYGVFENVDFKHFDSFDIVTNVVNDAYKGQPEDSYRNDLVVGRLQVLLADRGYKITNW